MNDKINELYNKLDAQDEIIEQQIAIINELKKRNKELEDGFKASIEELSEYATKIDKAIEYNKEVLTWTTNEPITDEIAYKNLEILGDKENE